MPSTTTLLILGATGDLTARLLLPGLGSLIAGGEEADLKLLEGVKIVGSARSAQDRGEWQDKIRAAFESVGAKGDRADELIAAADCVAADPAEPDGWKALLAAVEGDLVIYFALPPTVVTKVVPVLHDLDLPEHTVLAVEKPFGTDAESAARLNAELRKVVPEDRIHRVDHFLGQRAALAMLALRFDNRLLDQVWNAENVERVEIVYDEQLGLEGRAGYYDGAGALRDMLQSHLLQVLAIAATEAPLAMDAVNLRDALATALRATHVWPHGRLFPNTDQPSRRARYTAGKVGDRVLPSYVDEEGVDPDRGTETLAEVALEVLTARWAGVPFLLRSGKAIGKPRDEIAAPLRPVRFRPEGQTGDGEQERVVFGFKPPRVEVTFTAAGGEMPFQLEPGDVEGRLPKSPVTEYGEVLRGVLGDDPTLSVRGDVAEQCWRIVQPVLDAWAAGEVPLDEYPAGSQGPDSWS